MDAGKIVITVGSDGQLSWEKPDDMDTLQLYAILKSIVDALPERAGMAYFQAHRGKVAQVGSAPLSIVSH